MQKKERSRRRGARKCRHGRVPTGKRLVRGLVGSVWRVGTSFGCRLAVRASFRCRQTGAVPVAA